MTSKTFKSVQQNLPVLTSNIGGFLKLRMHKAFLSAFIAGAAVLPTSICFADNSFNYNREKIYGIEENIFVNKASANNDSVSLGKKEWERRFSNLKEQFDEHIINSARAHRSENLKEVPNLISTSKAMIYASGILAKQIRDDKSVDENFRDSFLRALSVFSDISTDLLGGLGEVKEFKNWKYINQYRDVTGIVNKYIKFAKLNV